MIGAYLAGVDSGPTTDFDFNHDAHGRGGVVASERILDLNEDNFDEQINRETQPILVDFWASWCQPCKAVAPTLAQIAEEMSGQAVVAKVNVDDNGDLANRFGIRSIPTLVVFKGGKVVDQMIGAAPKDHIVRLIHKHLT
jgi:thioredoxin 1